MKANFIVISLLVIALVVGVASCDDAQKNGTAVVDKKGSASVPAATLVASMTPVIARS